MAMGLNPNSYAALVAYFRRAPGDVSGAARASGLDYRTAGRAWDGRGKFGPYNARSNGGRPYEWMRAPTIKGLFALEAEENKNIEATMAEKARDLSRRELELREEALKLDADTIRFARANTFNGLVAMAQMTDGVATLCKKLNAIMTEVDPGQPNKLPCSFGEAFLLLQRWQSTGRGLIASADMLLQIERLRANLPTTIVGFETKHATLEDAERELEQANHAMERARKLQLVVNNVGGIGRQRATR